MLASLPAPLMAELGKLPAAELDAILSAFAPTDRQRIALALAGTHRDLPQTSAHSAWMVALMDEAAAVITGGNGRITRAAAEALTEAGGPSLPKPILDRAPAGPSLFDGIRNALPLGRTAR